MEFTLHFDQLQQHYGKMVLLIDQLSEKDEETAGKLKTALTKGLTALAEQTI